MPYVHRSYGSQWVEPMPRVPDFLINNVVYLYRDRLEADTGAEIGGSGFLLGMNSATGTGSHCYVVTCRHVVLAGSTVVRLNLKHGSSGYEKTSCLEFTQEDWVCHPEHDLAICPLPHDADILEYSQGFLGYEHILTKEQCVAQYIGPGDDLLYIGRFMNHAGRYQNMPSVRFGNISMNPSEEEPIEWDDTDTGVHRKQVAYLVEARSRSGYSGSPVFFINEHNKSNPRLLNVMFELRLLGIDFAHIPELVTLRDPRGYLNGSRWQVEIHAGMMGVIPSWYLLDFLHTSPRLIEQRRRDDEHYAAWQCTGELDTRIIEPPKVPITPGQTVNVIDRDGKTFITIPGPLKS